MRGPEDIIHMTFQVMGAVELDLERIEEDSVWESVCREFDISNPAQRKEALGVYLSRYLSVEMLLEFAPMTNGPASIVGCSVEVLESKQAKPAGE